jgi:hypothetical protein
MSWFKPYGPVLGPAPASRAKGNGIDKWERRTCPLCRRDVAVKKSGRLFFHRNLDRKMCRLSDYRLPVVGK